MRDEKGHGDVARQAEYAGEASWRVGSEKTFGDCSGGVDEQRGQDEVSFTKRSLVVLSAQYLDDIRPTCESFSCVTRTMTCDANDAPPTFARAGAVK